MKKKLTIVHTEASDGWGGQEIRIFTECLWLRQQGHKIIIFAPSHSQIYQRAKAEGLEVFHVQFAKSSQLTDIFKVFRLLKKIKPDVIGTHSSVDSWVSLIAGSLAGIRCRLRYRHVSTPVRNSALNRWQYQKLCHHIITTADCISNSLIKNLNISEKKVSTIPTGLNPPDQLIDKDTARINLAKELGVSTDSRFIGQISVLRSWKGHIFLIDAFEQLADSFQSLHLVLVGDGPCMQILTNHVANLKSKNRIHFVGHKTDPYQYFRAFEGAVLASTKNEGVPQSLLQAMWAECPVIGTNVGGIPEIVLDKTTGTLIPPSDSVSLENAITDNLQNQDSIITMVDNAKKMVAEKYLITSMGKQILEIIETKLTI